MQRLRWTLGFVFRANTWKGGGVLQGRDETRLGKAGAGRLVRDVVAGSTLLVADVSGACATRSWTTSASVLSCASNSAHVTGDKLCAGAVSSWHPRASGYIFRKVARLGRSCWYLKSAAVGVLTPWKLAVLPACSPPSPRWSSHRHTPCQGLTSGMSCMTHNLLPCSRS